MENAMTINSVGRGTFPSVQGHRDIRDLMEDWISNERDFEILSHKRLFIDRVRDFLTTGSNRLEIEDIDITELPEFLRRPEITRQLQELIITRTNLEEIPEWISDMTHLQVFKLEDNFHLDSLPETLGQLANLRELVVIFATELESKEFTFPETIRNLQLTYLEVSGIDQSEICPWLDSQLTLTYLTLNNCDLVEIPNEVFRLAQLNHLDLSCNNILGIDDQIENLGNLESLNLSSNLIFDIREGVFTLDGGCQVNLTENQLDAAELRRIDHIIEDDDYRGPEITTDAEAYINSDSSEDEFKDEELNVVDSVRSFYETIRAERPAQIDVLTGDATASRALGALIVRLQENIPYSHSFAPRIYAVLAESLSLAAQNPEYRLACFHVIEGATNTCGDGIIAIILRLSLLRQEMLLDLDQPAQVLDFVMKGRLAMSVLEASAANHVAGQKIEIINSIRTAHPLISQEELERLAAQRYKEEIDPVEVYLVYPMALRERLQLPLELTNMLFAAHARVSQHQLSEAAAQVKEKLGDRPFVVNFLVHDELWLKLLEKEFPEVYAQLATKQDRLAKLKEGDAGDDPYVAFAKEKERALLQMTGQLLDKLQPRLEEEQEVKRARLD